MARSFERTMVPAAAGVLYHIAIVAKLSPPDSAIYSPISLTRALQMISGCLSIGVVVAMSLSPLQDESPPPNSSDKAGSTETAEGRIEHPKGLIEIAALEAERASRKLRARADDIFNELETNADPKILMVQERINALADMGTAVLPVVMEQINGSTKSGVENRGRAAAFTLARILGRNTNPEGNAVVAAVIDEGLTSEVPFTRSMTARALGISGIKSWAPRLETLLSDKDLRVVSEAANGLAEMDARESIPSLHAILQHEDGVVRNTAVKALARLNQPESSQVLLPLLDEAWVTDEVRSSLFGFIGTHGGLESLQKLSPFVESNNKAKVRTSAVQAIEAIGLRVKGAAHTRSITLLRPQLAGSASSEVVQQVARSLHNLGDESGLARLLDDDTKAIRSNPSGFRSYVARAKVYYGFQEYGNAIDDLKDAMRNDRRGVLEIETRVLMAACYAGLKNFRSAKGNLKKLGDGGFAKFLKDYPEFESMAKDSRYADLFE